MAGRPLPQARERVPTLPLQRQRRGEQRQAQAVGTWRRPGFGVSLSWHRAVLGRGERSRPACAPQGSLSFAFTLQIPGICSVLPSRLRGAAQILCPAARGLAARLAWHGEPGSGGMGRLLGAKLS